MIKYRKIEPASDSNIRNIAKQVSVPSKRRIYLCIECEDTFTSFKQLRAHEALHKSNCNNLLCEYCFCLYASSETLEKHIKISHAKKLFQCYLCKKEYKSKYFLAQHNIKQHKRSGLLFHCAICTNSCDSITSRSSLDDHYKSMHLIMNPCEKTPDYDDMQMYEEFLEDIMPSSVDDNALDLPEGWDQIELQFPELLESSSNKETLDGFKITYECPKCCKKFVKLNELLFHLAEYHNLFILHCKYCEKVFNRKAHLEVHKRVCDIMYRQKVNFTCDICHEDLHSKLAYNYHMKTHKGMINNGHHSCPYCAKLFHAGRSLYTHIRVVHSLAKPQICQLCDRTYPTVDHLRKHVNSQHQKDRPYVCGYCSKQFFQMCHLKQHVLIHTTGKPYFCNLCNKKFWKKISADRHMLRYHDFEKCEKE